MNDASNVIITNNKSDLTYVKFNKLNNKAKSPINISEIIQKANQSKSKSNNNSNINDNKKSNNNNNHAYSNSNQNKNNHNNNEQKNLNISMSFTGKNYFFLKLNRYFSTKIKIIILIIFFICSILFLAINLYDYIIYIIYSKYYIKKNWLIYNFTIFLLQIFFSFCLLLYQIIILFVNQGENHNFIIISIIFTIISTLLRIYIFLHNIKLSISIMLNFVYSIFIFFINIVFLITLILANKKKKNALQNIDEIVYFTENNNMPNHKKEKDNYNIKKGD